jgi:hypothetical protein
VTGWTGSSDFPTHSAYDDSPNGNWDLFLTKLSASGGSLVYSTYLGGSGYDYGLGVAVDGAGFAYVAGGTNSADLPTQSAYDGNLNGGGDALVARFLASGNSLVYCTYLGGSEDEECYEIAVDSSGCAYVTGWTASADFPTQDAYDDTYNGGGDVFVTKLSSSGDSLVYSTYLGGAGEDAGLGVAVDGSGRACVTGLTLSSDFPTQQAYDDSYNGGSDVFVTRLSVSGHALEYSTCLGGAGDDCGYDVAIDGLGYAHITGFTRSADFPTDNSYDDSHNGGSDAFVAGLSKSGNELFYSTFLGGAEDDFCYGVTVDNSGSVYAAGFTRSLDFPTKDPFDDSFNGNFDAFVAKLSSSQCCIGIRGNVDGDAADLINVSDMTYLIAFLFSGGAPPPCFEEGDVNADEVINISDMTYLVAYLFSGGPAPAACP